MYAVSLSLAGQRRSPKVPPQEAQGGVCTAVDRVYMRGPRQLICKSDPKILGYLDTGQYVTSYSHCSGAGAAGAAGAVFSYTHNSLLK